MTRRCRHENCFPDTTCALGHLDRADCEYWAAAGEAKEEASGSWTELEVSDIPWNSYALGTSDLAILGGRGRPVVVGLIGAPDSGKTSLLVYLYMWLLENGELPGWGFAGSWTLGGWESVVQYSRWTGEPPPSFPPHTSSTGRFPGLLHLSLRNGDGALRDVLFTDAPGEWFTQWAKAPADDSAAGARWVFQHANALLLLADSDALANSGRLPQARRATRNLVERVAAVAPHIPLGFTWTKTDIEVPEPTRKLLERSRAQFAPHSEIWKTTIFEPTTIAECLARAISLGDSARAKVVPNAPRFSNEPFLAFRGNDVYG
jgi:hypothetical protein